MQPFVLPRSNVGSERLVSLPIDVRAQPTVGIG